MGAHFRHLSDLIKDDWRDVELKAQVDGSVTPETFEEIDYQFLKSQQAEVQLSRISKLVINHGRSGKVLAVEIRGKISAGAPLWSFRDLERAFGDNSTHIGLESCFG